MPMRHQPVCLALLLIGVGAGAATQDVAITPTLRAGDEFRLEVKRTRQDSQRPRQNAIGTTPIDVRVLGVAAEGITLEWVPGDTTLDDPQLRQDPMLAAMSRPLAGLRLLVSLDADGAFVGLFNQAEVAAKVQAAVDIMLRDAAHRMPEAERRAFEELMAHILSPAVLIGTITSDVQTYFSLNGIHLSVARPVEVAIEQPSPLGGGVMPAVFRIQAETATADRVVLITKTTYDKAGFLEMVKSILAGSGKPVTAEALADVPPMELGDEGRFVFDREVGLMREVAVTRRFKAGEVSRLDAWHIRLVTAPRR